MIVHYRVNGKERKRLAEVIAKEIGVDAIYQGAPTFSYQMDYFTVDREGALVFDDENYSDEVDRVLTPSPKQASPRTRARTMKAPALRSRCR